MTRREAICALAALPCAHAADLSSILITSEGRVESAWPEPDRPIAAGSLMKPFVALAYGREFPRITCQRCWKPDGHGSIALVEAIAYSCNTYFLELAQSCSVDSIARVAGIYGLPAPAANTPECWIGLGEGWRVSPVSLARAYAELAARAAEPGPAVVLKGMRLSARCGTARAIHFDAFAKTGTGPCVHQRKGSGDGYAVALFPVERPRYTLLAGIHDSPGSEAARLAGLLMHSIDLD